MEEPAASEYRIPVVSVIGRSDSGKTGVMESLIRSLTERGWRVATVKHHHGDDVDVEGKDSWRHGRAGAVTRVLSAGAEYAVFRRVDRERTLAELVDAAGDADIVLAESFKAVLGPARIEVIRRARSDELVSDPSTLFGVITDDASLAAPGVPVYTFEEVATRLTDVIERAFLAPGAD
jgi:molybdopterin-guanine dinucleotide biosynthesis protein B